MTEQPNALEAARRIMERDAPAFLVEGKLGSDAVIVARAYLAAEARIRKLEEALRQIAIEATASEDSHALLREIYALTRRALAKEETP